MSRLIWSLSALLAAQPLHRFLASKNPDAAQLAVRAIRRVREHLHVSQAVFGAYLNASVSTVKKWETGDKKPSGAALRLRSMIERRGLEVLV
jgi:putative transcriptional regulator